MRAASSTGVTPSDPIVELAFSLVRILTNACDLALEGMMQGILAYVIGLIHIGAMRQAQP